MILTLPDLITPEELVLIKQKLAAVPFADGKATAGELLHAKKQNQQIPWDHPVMKDITNLVMQALGRHDAFMSAAQPRRLAAMLVSRYGPGMAYGSHVDSAVMGAPHHVRSDVSFTLFLSEPDTYEGRELAFEVAGSPRPSMAAGTVKRRSPPTLSLIVTSTSERVFKRRTSVRAKGPAGTTVE